MNWIKLTAALLITAIFNPLCCCLDLAAQPLGPAASETNAAHPCCAAAADERNDLGDHSQQECPHSSEKDSQINERALAQDGPQKPHQGVVYTLPPLPHSADAPQLPQARGPLTCRSLQEPASQRSLAYCVFLI